MVLESLERSWILESSNGPWPNPNDICGSRSGPKPLNRWRVYAWQLKPYLYPNWRIPFWSLQLRQNLKHRREASNWGSRNGGWAQKLYPESWRRRRTTSSRRRQWGGAHARPASCRHCSLQPSSWVPWDSLHFLQVLSFSSNFLFSFFSSLDLLNFQIVEWWIFGVLSDSFCSSSSSSSSFFLKKMKMSYLSAL